MSTRTFRVAPGVRLLLPKSVATAPGSMPAELKEGDVIELEQVSRYIRTRVLAGDLIEVTEHSPNMMFGNIEEV